MTTTFHLRSETKPLEHRSALTPTTAKALLDAGYAVNVERCTNRIFKDEEFFDAGATLVAPGTWTSAPTDHLIIGLKELEVEAFPLKHTHIQFAHCYKGQRNWQDVLSRFPRGGGTLLDLEFLQDESGRRVAAFGYHAGYGGAALAIKAWANQLENPGKTEMPSVKPYNDQTACLKDVSASLASGAKIAGKQPRVLVIGALGRCGRGAVDLCKQAGVPDDHILKWDMAETAKGGPFVEIVESDIFVNCIYLSEKIAPFVDRESLSSPKRNLSVVSDVSCDITNPHNPIPIYSENSTFTAPTLPVDGFKDPTLSVIAIDHLPTLLPRESSEAFSQALLPSLLQLKDRKTSRVWLQAEDLFKTMVAKLPEEKRTAENGAAK